MFKLKSNDIRDFPFQEYSKLNTSQSEDLAKMQFLPAYNSWMLPQINAHLATWALQKTDTGLIDPKATARYNIKSDWDIGLWRVITRVKRGSLVKAQSNPEFVNFSALVPLVMAAHKRFHNVPYRAWKIDGECPLVESMLLEAMLWRDDELMAGGPGSINRCSLGSERLLEIRQQGLTTKTGARVGSVAKPTSSWCLKGIANTELGKVPKLVGTMLTQIWVAHPSLRTNYMILDPYSWDNMPDPLVDEKSLFKEVDNVKIHKEDTADLPW